jgi:hypothetical protein
LSVEAIVVSRNVISTYEDYTKTLTPKTFTAPRMSHREIGGFYSATYELTTTDREESIALLNMSPGRDVKFYNEKGNLDWEGMIRSVALDTGIAVLENDLQNMANAVFVRYQPVGGGATVRSTTVEDALSQARWGKKTWVLSGGEVSAAAADQRAQVFLDQVFWAKPTLKSLNQGGTLSKIIKLRFTCIGYWHTLDWSVYNQTAVAGETSASTIAAAIFADADVAQFLTGYTTETNDTQLTQEYDADRKPTSILAGIAAYGDSDDDLWVAGVGPGRVGYYRQGAQATLPTV